MNTIFSFFPQTKRHRSRNVWCVTIGRRNLLCGSIFCPVSTPATICRYRITRCTASTTYHSSRRSPSSSTLVRSSVLHDSTHFAQHQRRRRQRVSLLTTSPTSTKWSPPVLLWGTWMPLDRTCRRRTRWYGPWRLAVLCSFSTRSYSVAFIIRLGGCGTDVGRTSGRWAAGCRALGTPSDWRRGPTRGAGRPCQRAPSAPRTAAPEEVVAAVVAVRIPRATTETMWTIAPWGRMSPVWAAHTRRLLLPSPRCPTAASWRARWARAIPAPHGHCPDPTRRRWTAPTAIPSRWCDSSGSPLQLSLSSPSSSLDQGLRGEMVRFYSRRSHETPPSLIASSSCVISWGKWHFSD